MSDNLLSDRQQGYEASELLKSLITKSEWEKKKVTKRVEHKLTFYTNQMFTLFAYVRVHTLREPKESVSSFYSSMLSYFSGNGKEKGVEIEAILTFDVMKFEFAPAIFW